MAAGLTRARADVEAEQPLAIAQAPAPATAPALGPAPTSASASAQEPAAPAREPSASILLVDDDEGGLHALHAVLEPLGQRLVAARSGEQALRRLLREEFAVILLDVRMPGLDGLQTARYIKTRARTRHIPIIFLTAHAEDVEHVFHAYAAGAVDYVVKPCDPDVLRSKVAVFVELQRERSERVREARGRAEAEAIAGTLQRHLLPDRLPQAPGLEMAARYRPSEQTAQVGGDWYDAILLPGGRVGLAIGDVVGHGVHAATLMAELRAALRAYAVTEPDSPGATLTLLNSLVARTHGRAMVATLLYMVIDADRRHARFASAGHPPPLLLDAGAGAARMLEHQAVLPLGVAEHTKYESWETELSPGATVLLYTDGLVERRGETIDTGLQRLCEALGEGPQGLEELCSHILTRAPGGRGAPDDTALLAARLLEQPAMGSLELDLPAEPESVSVARHRLERWLAEFGEGRDDAFALKLALSEVCANAVEHAYGPGSGHRFRVRAERREGAVAIEVSDEGRWRAPRGSQRGLGLGMSRRLMDSVEIERTPAGTTVRMRKAPPS